MKILSPNFKNNETIPKRYTCEGEDINPTLQFKELPENVISLAIIVHDPDAIPNNGFTHWVIWNIEPNTKIIQENSVPLGSSQGQNDAEIKGYRGPCPPPGKDHHYYFKLYALDVALELNEDNTKRVDLEKAMEGHIIEKAELIGLYKR